MRAKRGIVAETLLIYVVIGIIALFVPNPVSNAVGIGNRQNKIETTDTTTLINDKEGVPIAFRHITGNSDLQQKPTFWEWLGSLPAFVLILMLLGIVFPPVSLFLGKIYSGLKKETKKIVVSIDKALDNVHDPAVKETILSKMSETQDTSTKALVDKIQGKP